MQPPCAAVENPEQKRQPSRPHGCCQKMQNIRGHCERLVFLNRHGMACETAACNKWQRQEKKRPDLSETALSPRIPKDAAKQEQGVDLAGCPNLPALSLKKVAGKNIQVREDPTAEFCSLNYERDNGSDQKKRKQFRGK